MAKSKKEIADRAEQESRYYAEKLKDFKTPYTTQGAIGDVNTGKFTEGALNSSRKELNERQLRYFQDFGKFTFKHGIEMEPEANGDEDAVIFGFDIIINTQTSPLFSTSSEDKITDFFAFGNAEGIREVQSREAMYYDFIEHFSKFFARTDSSFRNIKSFYIKGVEGLGELVNKASAIHPDKKQFTEYGKDSEQIKLTMFEDSYLNSGYLAMLYNTMAYSKINGKQIIPENLLRFDMSIVVSEIRKYNKVLNALEEGGDNVLNIVNDNVSRYKYNLYDCQFNFDSMSHPDSLKNAETSSTDEYTFNIHYKFVTLEMEKFQLQIGKEDIRKYINNGNVDVNSKLNGDTTSTIGLTDIPYRTNAKDYIRMDKTGEPGNNVNTFFKPAAKADNPDGTSSDDKSEIESQKEQEAISKSGDRNLPTLDEESQAADGTGIPLAPLYEGSYITDYKDAYSNGYKIIDEGNGNQDVAEPKTGIAAMISDTKDFALGKARKARDTLINNTLQKIRTSTGLRRMSSPHNVYSDPNTLGFVKGIGAFIGNQIKDFANTEITSFIQKSPVGNLPISDIKTLNIEYNTRIHEGEGGGSISDFDNKDTTL